MENKLEQMHSEQQEAQVLDCQQGEAGGQGSRREIIKGLVVHVRNSALVYKEKAMKHLRQQM